MKPWALIAAVVVLGLAVAGWLRYGSHPPADTVEEFCQIEIGMTADEVRDVAGEPSFERGDPLPEMTYVIDSESYVAQFNTSDGTVRDLEITTNPEMGEPCASYR